MTTATYNKIAHLENARKLAEKDDTSSLRYASLELRYFLEAHVYERLSHEIQDLPQSIIETWQPQKAMKILSMFDEHADKDINVQITNQDGSECIKIEYNNIKNSKLNSYYNALGNFLHLPEISKLELYKFNKTKLIKIMKDLERLTAGNLITIKQKFDNFKCNDCASPIMYTMYYISNNDKITCQNSNCNTVYEIDHNEESGTINFGSSISFPCESCKNEMKAKILTIKPGDIIKCKNCLSEYMADLHLRILTP